VARSDEASGFRARDGLGGNGEWGCGIVDGCDWEGADILAGEFAGRIEVEIAIRHRVSVAGLLGPSNSLNLSAHVSTNLFCHAVSLSG